MSAPVESPVPDLSSGWLAIAGRRVRRFDREREAMFYLGSLFGAAFATSNPLALNDLLLIPIGAPDPGSDQARFHQRLDDLIADAEAAGTTQQFELLSLVGSAVLTESEEDLLGKLDRIAAGEGR